MKRMRRFMALLLTVTLVGSNAVFVQAAGTEQDAVESTADNAADNLQSDAAGDNTAATQDSTEKNTEAEEETLETAEIGTKNSYQGKAVSIMAGETAEITSRFDTVKSWRSEDEGIAKVDDNGGVTGVAVGRTKVTAEDYEGNTQTFEISVSELQYFDTTIFDYKVADNTAAHYDAMDGARYLDDLKLDNAYSGWGSIGKGYCGACENDGRYNVEIGVVPDRNSYAVVTYEKGISMHADGRATVDGNDVIVKWDDLLLDWENGVPVYIGGLGNLESEEESAADAVSALTYLKTTGKAVSCVVNPETMNILKNIRAELLGSDQGGGLKIYSAEPKKNTYNRNTTMNFIITTGADAAEMKVVLDGKEQKVLKTITDTNADGTVTWTLTVRAPRQKGEYTYNVYASDSAGNQSEPSNISVKVK